MLPSGKYFYRGLLCRRKLLGNQYGNTMGFLLRNSKNGGRNRNPPLWRVGIPKTDPKNKKVPMGDPRRQVEIVSWVFFELLGVTAWRESRQDGRRLGNRLVLTTIAATAIVSSRRSPRHGARRRGNGLATATASTRRLSPRRSFRFDHRRQGCCLFTAIVATAIVAAARVSSRGSSGFHNRRRGDRIGTAAMADLSSQMLRVVMFLFPVWVCALMKWSPFSRGFCMKNCLAH